VVKHGQSGEGKQRYKCRNSECSRCTFIREYAYRGYLPEVKQQIADMAINGSETRDTARVFKISRTTVTETLKKIAISEQSMSNVWQNLNRLKPLLEPFGIMQFYRVMSRELMNGISIRLFTQLVNVILRGLSASI
jgi:transposase